MAQGNFLDICAVVCKERKVMQQESLRPLRSLRLNVFFAPAHEHTLPEPAVHLMLSRAGG